MFCKMPTITFRFKTGLLALLLLGSLLSGCGPDLCKCLQEAEKENPDQAVMDKCRDAFAKMEMDEVKAAVEKCK